MVLGKRSLSRERIAMSPSPNSVGSPPVMPIDWGGSFISSMRRRCSSIILLSLDRIGGCEHIRQLLLHSTVEKIVLLDDSGRNIILVWPSGFMAMIESRLISDKSSL